MKKLMITLISILFLMSSLSLTAQRGDGPRHGKGPGKDHPGMGMGPGFINDKFLEKIGVSDKVREEIRKMMKDLKVEMMEGYKQIKDKRLAIKDEMLKDSLDEEKIKSLYNEIAELHKQQMLKAEYKKLDIAKLLTKEQRKKIIDHMMQRQKEFYKKMKGHTIDE